MEQKRDHFIPMHVDIKKYPKGCVVKGKLKFVHKIDAILSTHCDICKVMRKVSYTYPFGRKRTYNDFYNSLHVMDDKITLRKLCKKIFDELAQNMRN